MFLITDMASARFNIYWFLSLIAPLGIMLCATYWHRRSFLVAGVLASLVVTYVLCNLAVQTKWRTRIELARTVQEQEYATADGANMVFTAYLTGPAEAIIYTTAWGIVGWRLWPRVRGQQHAET